MTDKDSLNPRKQPSQPRSRNTVAVILEAAAQVFSSSGYAGATTNHIAERAGVSIGSLYQYFPNKNAILLKLAEQHTREGLDFLDRIVRDVGPSACLDGPLIRRIIEAMIAFHKRDPELHRISLEELPIFKHIANGAAEVEEIGAGFIETLLRNTKRVRKQNLKMAARLFVQTVDWLSHRYILYETDVVEEDVFISELTDMMARYLLADPKTD